MAHAILQRNMMNPCDQPVTLIHVYKTNAVDLQHGELIANNIIFESIFLYNYYQKVLQHGWFESCLVKILLFALVDAKILINVFNALSNL